MKIPLFALLFAASAFAQAPSAVLPAACGPQAVSFTVHLDKNQHAVLQPEPGKARVYFVQASGLIRYGIDGAWVGANRGHSYFSVSVEPGEHHVCAQMQGLGAPMAELTHFTAKAGEVYFYRARLPPTLEGLYLFFNPIDSDEGKSLIASYSLSVSSPKKQ